MSTPLYRLYHVQDSDRALYVVASSWQDAVTVWRNQMQAEAGDDYTITEEDQPEGVKLVATAHAEYPELLLPREAPQ